MRVRRLMAVVLLAMPLVAALSVSAPVPKGSGASASDWPQWRGPNRDGISTEKGLLAKWPAGGPKLLWKIEEATAIGTGYGSVSVVGDKAYMIGADGAKKDAKEFCTCISTKDGAKVWQTKLATSGGNFLDMWGGGPRATPTVDGELVFVLGAMGDLTCLTADKGEVKWTKNLIKDLSGATPGNPWWGHSESPLVDGELVVVTPGGKGGVTALDKKTGKVAWVCKEATDDPQYSSLVIAEVGGVKQYVTQMAKSGVGVRAKDGKLLWKVGEIPRRTAVIPTPVVSSDGHVFFTAGYGAGCECFKLEKDGDGTKATKVYSKNTAFANHHGGVILVGDKVYGHSDSGGWLCFDYKAGGEPLWKARGVGKGSVTFADGHLYCYSENDGTCALVKPDEKQYDEVSRFTIPGKSALRPGQGKVWPHPTIAGGKLFLRDFEKLFVFDIAAK